jgi:hypothetical protein
MIIVMFVLALLTGSPDCSILATDVETGSIIARIDNAHEWVDLLVWLVCHDLDYRVTCADTFVIFVVFASMQSCSQ